MSLEELEKKLYSTTRLDHAGATQESVPPSSHSEIPEVWGDLKEVKEGYDAKSAGNKKMGWRAKLLLLSFGLLVCGAIIFFVLINDRGSGAVVLTAYAPEDRKSVV